MSLIPWTHNCPDCGGYVDIAFKLSSSCKCGEGEPPFSVNDEVWYNSKPGIVKAINGGIYTVMFRDNLNLHLTEDKLSARYSGPLRQEILGKI